MARGPDVRNVPPSLTLQMRWPAVRQANVIYQILEDNYWCKLNLVTCYPSPGNKFLRTLIGLMRKGDLPINSLIKVDSPWGESVGRSLAELDGNSDPHVVVLDCGPSDGQHILLVASQLGLTRSQFVWIATEAFLTKDTLSQDTTQLPVGLVGIRSAEFNPVDRIHDALLLTTKALLNMQSMVASDSREPAVTTEDGTQAAEAPELTNSVQYMINTTVKGKTGRISFDKYGRLATSTYDIWTVRLTSSEERKWVHVGTSQDDKLRWNSPLWVRNTNASLTVLRVVTLEEHPFIFTRKLDENNQCPAGTMCTMPKKRDEHNGTLDDQASIEVEKKCCYGLCHDLLHKLSQDLNFQYELYVVRDGKYGGLKDNLWNGMVGDLLYGRADMAVSSFTITKKRSEVIDFSAPYFYTNLGILIYKKEAPTPLASFMKPLDWSMWVGIFVTLHLAAIFATIYEWCSPYGLTPKARNRPRIFGFPSALNLCWSILFSHTVATKTPKCWSSRFLINLWAAFSVIFLASYTANLAAFMVDEKTINELNGIDDPKASIPSTDHPLIRPSKGFRFGTVRHSSPESFMREFYPAIEMHMRKDGSINTGEAVDKLKAGHLDAFIMDMKIAGHLDAFIMDHEIAGHLDAFIMDQAILEYEALIDPECNLKVVGKPFSSDVYGIGLPKNSSLTSEVTRLIHHYTSTGYLDRLYRQWYNSVPCSVGNEGMEQCEEDQRDWSKALASVTTRRTCFCVLSTCKNVGTRRASVRGEYRLRTESYGFGSTQTRLAIAQRSYVVSTYNSLTTCATYDARNRSRPDVACRPHSYTLRNRASDVRVTCVDTTPSPRKITDMTYDQPSSFLDKLELDVGHFTGVFVLLLAGLGCGILTLFMEFVIHRFLVPRLRSNATTTWLAISQRFHRALKTKPARRVNTATFLRNIGISGLTGNLGRPPSSFRDSRAEEEFYDFYKILSDTSKTPLNNVNIQKLSTIVSRLNSTQQSNIAIQTDDVEDIVNHQLRDIDANIQLRLRVFERDLHDMRERLAQALREKEELLRRLAVLENPSARAQMEAPLVNGSPVVIRCICGCAECNVCNRKITMFENDQNLFNQNPNEHTTCDE
ncbi:Glutamate receptor ionotropic, NMDA 3A [Branchiostoma belcheri]|nr:Glutamate receptor ionotropic, NMDA 3A [Branchiostoma belcheri]